ncbi:type II toxin-antitoxin system mRNA interferase toxin, RelE/StbE family [Trueperella sp. LYQ141]
MTRNYRDHALSSNSSHRECHIEPDWLFIYYKQDDVMFCP